MRCGDESPLIGLSTQRDQAFQIALQIVEIDRVTMGGPTFHVSGTANQATEHRRLDQFVQLALEYQPGLEQPHNRTGPSPGQCSVNRGHRLRPHSAVKYWKRTPSAQPIVQPSNPQPPSIPSRAPATS